MPKLVQFEIDIDKELENEEHETKRCIPPPTDLSFSDKLESSIFDDTPQPQVTNNDLASLHERVSLGIALVY